MNVEEKKVLLNLKGEKLHRLKSVKGQISRLSLERNLLEETIRILGGLIDG